MTDGISVDMSSFKKFARAMRAAEVAAGIEFAKYVTAMAAAVAAEERTRSAAFSQRIPGSVRTLRLSRYAAAVKAGGSRAPGAAPINHGGIPGTFQHPVYGRDDVLVSQKAQPFVPTEVAMKPRELAAAKTAVRSIWWTVGFK